MSIAVAENAGLVPCELPDHWTLLLSTKTTKSSTNTILSEESCSTNAFNNLTNFPEISTQSKAVTTSTFSSPKTTTSTVIGSATSTICILPRSSPATAAVTVSAEAVLGLAPVVPVPSGVVPLPTTIGSACNAGGGGGVATTSHLIANHSSGTLSDSINSVSPSTIANVLARFSTLQRQQNIYLSNNNSLLNKDLLPSYFQHQQQNYPSVHKATTTATNIAAALHRSANMNAVASPISANSTTSSNRKIRKKNDSKANLPQSQINKCINEKRRRELENNYIEQLSEFLQLNKRGDMTSTKPDKAAILNQVVKTYRDICDRGQSRDISSPTKAPASTGTTSLPSTTTTTSVAISANNSISNSNNRNSSTRCSRCTTDNCSTHPVQQGEVSSTEPPLPEPSLLNGQVPEISAYFEALEHYISSVGWVLLQVNSAGIIESCTQNIRDLIGYEKHELYRQPLYMYLYPGDHAKLDPIISNMSSASNKSGNSGTANSVIHDVNSGWSIGIESEDHSSSCGKQERSNSIKVRMLVKDMRSATQTSGLSKNTNNDKRNSVDQTLKYEEVVLIAAPVKDNSESSSVLCLITRPEDDSPLEMNIQQYVQHPTIEQVTFKLDIHGKIITLDATTLREHFKLHLSQWSGRLLHDLCHPQDLSALKTHLRDIQDSTSGLNALNASQSPGSELGINPPISNVTSKPFRLRLGAPDIYVHVKANSRLFINNTPGESDFIMSVQTLLPECGNDMKGNNKTVMSDNSGLLTTSMTAMSPGSSLVSSLVSNLSMDSFVNNNSVSSPLVNVSGLGGLVGGGGIPPNTTQTTNVGGPLMTSAIINGTGNVGSVTGSGGPISVNTSGMSSQRTAYSTSVTSGVASSNSTLVNSFTSSPASHEGPSFYSNEFDLDLPHSSFEIDPTVSAWNDSRPNSRASVTTPVSTPRPPSAGHGLSPAVCPSPSTPFQLSSQSAASLSSPQSNTSQSGAGISGAPFSFGFPPFDSNEKIEKDNLNNNNSTNNTNNNMSAASSVNITANVSNGVNQLMLGSGGSTALSLNSEQQNQAQQQQDNSKPPTESERLRNLLTNKTHSTSTISLHGSDGEEVKFYKQEEDKESGHSNMAGMFKMGQVAAQGTSRMFGLQKSANSNNPMLLSLLKSEDDEKGGQSIGRSGDIARIKDEHHGSHGSMHSNTNSLSADDLRRILKHQGDPAMTRKRSLNDPDDGLSAKRNDDRPSKLCETNKMLARLLRNPPKNITMNIQTGIKIIPDKVPAAVGRVSSTLSGISNVTSGSISGGLASMSNKNSIVTTMTGSITSANSARGRGQHKQTLQQLQQASDVYLNQQQQTLDTLQIGTNLQRPPQTHQQSHTQLEFSSSTSNHPFAAPPLSTTASSTTATSTPSVSTGTSLACLADGDSELSKILDSVMDYVTDDQPFAPATPTGLTPQQINERLAISEIQKSLMVETSAFRNSPSVMIGNASTPQMIQQQLQQLQQHQPHSQSQPPAYPGSMMTVTGTNASSVTPQQLQQQQMQMMRMQQMLETMRANQSFQRPPPNYSPRGRAPPMNAVATPGGGVMSSTQRYRTLAQQQIVQQQKERLLQQQQKQHMLVPENATARNDQLCLNPNIGTLLNTVAPNVTLSRTNMPPDSQLSPNFAQNMLQQQLSPGQRNASFSPQSNTGYGQQYSQSGQRLSPQQQQLSQQPPTQQQQMAFQSGNAGQLSPRQPHFGSQGSNTTGNSGIPSPGITPSASPQQWPTQPSVNTQQRTHSLQHHNPMLSAQLQGVSPYSSRQYQQQRGRTLNSPSGTGPSGPGGQSSSPGSTTAGLQRQNSFQTNDTVSFASRNQNSPSPQSPYNAVSVFQQNPQQQIQRLHRQTSIPPASQHLPAGNPASSEYVKQELRAVVSGRAAAAANSIGNNVSIGGSSDSGSVGGPSGLRVTTSQSLHGPQTSQASILSTNSTNSMAMTQQQPLGSVSSGNGSNTSAGSNTGIGGVIGNINSGLLSTPPDPTMGFSFDAQDFFGSSSTR